MKLKTLFQTFGFAYEVKETPQTDQPIAPYINRQISGHQSA
jgi:hypothetical protein